MELKDMTALELGAAIRKGEISAVEAAEFSLGQIERYDKQFSCFVTVQEDVLQRAEEVQKGIAAGAFTSPLAGVPMGIKDNMCQKGIQTSCGSRMLAGFKPTYSATAVEEIMKAGAVPLGKLNMDEFAMGSTSETSFFGVTRNPWNAECVPGGSSGGSAAAVAAGECFYSLGSDTGGSIRQPASFCGVTGIKPTYGAVSRFGLVAYASSLDQIGPLARNAADCAAVLGEIMKQDRRDNTSVATKGIDLQKVLHTDVKGMRIGIPADFFGEGLDKEVAACIEAAAKQLESMGATVEKFDMPIVKYAIPAYYIIASAEASSNLSRYDGIKYGYRAEHPADLLDLYTKSRSEGFGMEVKRRIMLGCFVLSSGYYDAYYRKALQAKALIKAAFDRAFERYDLILGPVAPTTALKIGENLSDPLKMYLGDIYTVMINLAGLPAASVPCGFDGKGMPVGMHLIGHYFDEEKILGAAHAYQQVTDWHKRKPTQLDRI
ncbi:MAG: Asp-tRNA(Asn)/Glu-tRNA(Gln) amidotransferase subunit GatA [Clostridia bacterium]|nr:Asp-tRNA(Asn)/Glu-tRNA(Gln) amidotransferase subunit GatA [Clostridia bacterium]